ncbi:hypothetical protein PHJA_002920000, partial [Phtheirospermum japonicum]
IYEEPREAHEVPNFFSKFELTASLTSVSIAIDNWLRECHGRSIVLISPSSELIKLMRTMIMEREENPSCCSLYLNKCWRHYVADVKILNMSMDESVNIIHKSTKETTNVASSSAEQNQILRPKNNIVVRAYFPVRILKALIRNLNKKAVPPARPEQGVHPSYQVGLRLFSREGASCRLGIGRLAEEKA